MPDQQFAGGVVVAGCSALAARCVVAVVAVLGAGGASAGGWEACVWVQQPGASLLTWRDSGRAFLRLRPWISLRKSVKNYKY